LAGADVERHARHQGNAMMLAQTPRHGIILES
jgi:hypothetical protein